MSIFRCFLLLALIATASATFGKRRELSLRGHCGLLCGLTKKIYVRPSHNSGKCLGVLGFLLQGVSAKLNLVKSIFTAHANIEIATDINVAVSTCVSVSKGLSLVINKWVDGLGLLFENLIVGISRLIFCVLGNPWHKGNFISRWITHKRGAPAVCDKNFGSKWGLKAYLRGYTSYDEIVEFYGIVNVRAKIEKLLKHKGYTIGGLKGTYKVIVDAILRLDKLLQRKFSIWSHKDYVEVSKCLITITAAVGSGYKAGTGQVVVQEFTEYLAPCYKKEFNVELVTETTVITEEIKKCHTVSFDGALVADSDVNEDVDSDTTSNDIDDDGTTTKTTEWETIYDADGNVISTTKPDDED